MAYGICSGGWAMTPSGEGRHLEVNFVFCFFLIFNPYSF